MLTTVAFLLVVQSKPVVQTFSVKGVDRMAMIVAPAKGDKPGPLVFVFHGHGGNMRNAQRSFDIETLWPEALVVYPQGLPSKGKTDPEGTRNGWQQNPEDYNGRDLDFFDTMLKDLKKQHKVDPKRVYVTGHSNGGRFTYVLLSKRGDQLAAVAPCAAPAMGLLGTAKPLPIFIMAGERDQIVPFASQQLSITLVRKLLGTEQVRANKEGLLTKEVASSGLELDTYVHPGGHMVPREALPLVVDFFKRHSR